MLIISYLIPFPHKANIEKLMKKFYDALCEKDKRRYAAIESAKSPHDALYLLDCTPQEKIATKSKRDTP